MNLTFVDQLPNKYSKANKSWRDYYNLNMGFDGIFEPICKLANRLHTLMKNKTYSKKITHKT